MKEITFSAINLGCTKNLVDMEFTIGEILSEELGDENEYIFYGDPEDDDVEYVIVNTCGFLSSSREEAEDTLTYLDKLGKKIILMGCYIEVKNNDFLGKLKNLESVITYDKITNIKEIWKEKKRVELKDKLYNLKKDKLKEYLESIGGNNKDKKANIYGSDKVRAYLTADKSYEYIKISEGCNNNCTFCIIPNIRGRQTSRTIEDIIKEVKTMIDFGIKEIEIISEDTTRYGEDLYGENRLIELLKQIDNLEGDFKYRLFYMYPDILTQNHLDELKNLKKFIPYFDFPFQHISPNILKRMGRFYDEEHIYNLIKHIKSNFKNPFFHTNFIIGFPGETKEDFEKLVEFAKEVEFDSVSIFGYHDENLASSSKLDNKVPDKEIEKRVKILSKELDKIYDKKYNSRIGKRQIGFIEEVGHDYLLVRPEIKAPEIDELDEISKINIIEGKIDYGNKIEYLLAE